MNIKAIMLGAAAAVTLTLSVQVKAVMPYQVVLCSDSSGLMWSKTASNNKHVNILLNQCKSQGGWGVVEPAF
tara:strand:+ start:787 stop:1002 length:216 start_codon:yes stop_codon:yes gene_type:complete